MGKLTRVSEQSINAINLNIVKVDLQLSKEEWKWGKDRQWNYQDPKCEIKYYVLFGKQSRDLNILFKDA